jgi:hypothetical protein
MQDIRIGREASQATATGQATHSDRAGAFSVESVSHFSLAELFASREKGSEEKDHHTFLTRIFNVE